MDIAKWVREFGSVGVCELLIGQVWSVKCEVWRAVELVLVGVWGERFEVWRLEWSVVAVVVVESVVDIAVVVALAVEFVEVAAEADTPL
jgi:hypothetical protein